MSQYAKGMCNIVRMERVNAIHAAKVPLQADRLHAENHEKRCGAIVLWSIVEKLHGNRAPNARPDNDFHLLGTCRQNLALKVTLDLDQDFARESIGAAFRWIGPSNQEVARVTWPHSRAIVKGADEKGHYTIAKRHDSISKMAGPSYHGAISCQGNRTPIDGNQDAGSN